MNKLLFELQLVIDLEQRRLTALREEYDRVDANNPHRSLEIQRDIDAVVTKLTRLTDFQKLMTEK